MERHIPLFDAPPFNPAPPRVVAVFVAPKRADPLESRDSVELVAGRGIVGDRFFDATDRTDRPVTLIEREALDGARREYGVEFDAKDARRNIVTQGIALNHLVNVRFRIGEVVLEGIKLCEPCAHLAKLTSDTFSKSLVHRGGLRATIIGGGTVRVGDRIVSLGPPPVSPVSPEPAPGGPPKTGAT